MPQINHAGLVLIESFEGCKLTAYQDSGGVWTIGVGHTPATEGETITQPEATALLGQDVIQAEHEVASLIEIVLTPNEFSALVSFQFNTGAMGSSPGTDLLNAHEFQQAWDDHFCLYIHDANGTTLEGLIRRRAAERALFFNA
jgi:lysozyme